MTKVNFEGHFQKKMNSGEPGKKRRYQPSKLRKAQQRTVEIQDNVCSLHDVSPFDVTRNVLESLGGPSFQLVYKEYLSNVVFDAWSY